MRFRPALAVVLGLACLSGLAACGSSREEEAAAAAAPQRQLEPIQALRTIEIGRTRNGYAISAFGTARTTGYSAPTLRPRRDGKPGVDGMLDFDFVALPPDPSLNMPQGTLAAREIRGDIQLPSRQLRGVTGIRVHTLTNSGQLTF